MVILLVRAGERRCTPPSLGKGAIVSNILATGQNWAKIAPVLAVITAILLFALFKPADALFWCFLNIPLYLLHQTEEHLWPGGFKDYVNRTVFSLPPGEETLTDSNVFWINIILVWLAFAAFGLLALVDLGFGLMIIVFSILNCITHVTDMVRRRRWNPGSIMATIQLVLSCYAAYYVTIHGLKHPLAWWVGSIIFSAVVHLILFKAVMGKERMVRGTADITLS